MSDDSNLPPINSDAANPVPDESTPAPTGDPQDGDASVTFTPEQLDSLGLSDAKPGESFTITIEAGDAGPDGAPEFNVVSSEPASGSDVGDDSDLADISPLNDKAPEDDMASKSPLGIVRKPKAPRAGLPDIKKLRD